MPQDQPLPGGARRGRLGRAVATWRRRWQERAAGPSERVRIPPPLVRRRLPSGRGATEQPNVTGDGDAPLTPMFWLMLAATGVATGLIGDFLMLVLFNVQYLAFGYHAGSFMAAVAHTSDLRRVVVLLVAGIFGGVAWYLVRHYLRDEKAEIDDAVWGGEGQLSLRRGMLTSIVSEVVIGMGASMGREAAPKLMGGVSGSVLGTWARLTPGQRRLLVACGGGAGLAAVYNVPIGGALFTAEILCGTLALPVVLPALACSWIATATAWLYLPHHATYTDVPDYRVGASIMVWALLAGPVIGGISSGYIRLIGWVSHHRMSGRRILVSLPVGLTVLGVVGIAYPQLFGNGKDMAHAAFLGQFGTTLLLALFVLKPLVTAMCLGAGGSGGLFTPTMSTGAMLGGFLGAVWTLAWPGEPGGAFAMVGAVAMIGASMQAPLTALVLVLELTHSGFELAVPMMAATVTATVVARRIDGYSIYSARLSAA
jgi:chloride channel protein, CIC family